MPRIIFKLLWDNVKNKEEIFAYVKNLSFDGGYYWVYATVVPNIRDGQIVGFTSGRREPSREKVIAAEAHYRSLNGS